MIIHPLTADDQNKIRPKQTENVDETKKVKQNKVTDQGKIILQHLDINFL